MPEAEGLMLKIEGQWAGLELQRSFQREVANLLGRNTDSFPGAQPVSFAARHISELKHKDYYVCEKTDGLRYLMYCTNDGEQDIHYLIDRKNDYWYVRHLHFPHHQDKTYNRFHTDTIFDGELVEDVYPDRPSIIKYLVFDCLVLDKQSLMQKPLDKRLGYFKEYVLKPYKEMFAKTPDLPRPFIVEDKATEFSYGVEKMFKEIIPRVKQLHGNDGLIFTCRTTDYKFGTDEHILKWKPPQENTVDFLLHITWPMLEADPQDPDQNPQRDYLSFPEKFELFEYYGGENDYQLFAEMYVTPDEWERMKSENKELQDAVVECYLEVPIAMNGHTNGNGNPGKRWRFYRVRHDKEQGNYYKIVQSVMESIQDHITEDDLMAAASDVRTAWKKRAAEEAAKGR
jgi:mRNA guanylyltransferase